MNYRISIKAYEDIDNIWLHTLENWLLEQAERYVNQILDEIEYLANNPDLGKDFSFIRENYRCSKVQSHLIFYQTSDSTNEIEVIRILHQKMDIKNRLTD